MEFPRHIVAVSGLVSNEQGQILLVLSPRRGWEFPGGQVEQGETLVEALEREVYEEAGIRVAVGALVGVYSNIKQPAKLMFGFLADRVEGDLTTSSESVETEWVARHQVLERIAHRAIHDRMKDMLEFAGRVTYRAYTTDPYQVVDERLV